MTLSIPAFPLDDWNQRERFEHHIEHAYGWEYKRTHVMLADLADSPHGDTEKYPRGWDYRATQPPGFHLNYDKGVGHEEDDKGYVKIAGGILLAPNAASGPMLIAYWRRQRRQRWDARRRGARR
jgi:hypothetical protein